MKKIYITFLMIIPLLLFSQRENDNWYFGNQAAVNFANPNPVVLNNSQMDAIEACGTVSDANGNLLFYTNGETVWDREHQVMQNGSGLGGDSSSQQLAIVKHPGNPNQYFIITTADNSIGSSNTNTTIEYSIVDMSQGNIGNGGPLGAVLPNFTNIPIVDSFGNSFQSEAVTVVSNTSNQSYWVLIPNGTRMYGYAIDNNGFNNGNPVVSNLNFPVPLVNPNYYSVKASPKIKNAVNYTHLVCISLWNPDTNLRNQVYSFNSLNGSFTNDFSLMVNGLGAYLPEFNKDGSVLFLGYQNIYAVDLLTSTSSNVNFATIFTGTGSPYFGIQRNRKGEIYISRIGQQFLGRINDPDGNIFNMSVNMSALNLNNGSTMFGLPQLIALPYDDTYSPCMDNLTLIDPEVNSIFTYNVGKNIKTMNNYEVTADQSVIMNAGNSITLLPNTYIWSYKYIAKIVPCNPNAVNKNSNKIRTQAPIRMVLELDKEERLKLDKDITIYPNPVTDILTVQSSEKINDIEIYDISGKKIKVTTNDNKVNVKNLPSGSYIIRLTTQAGMITKKFIKR